MRKTLEDCDKRGDHESEEFEKASKVFIRRFVCTIDPMPEEVQAAFKHLKEDPTVYLTVYVLTYLSDIKDNHKYLINIPSPVKVQLNSLSQGL